MTDDTIVEKIESLHKKNLEKIKEKVFYKFSIFESLRTN